MWPWGRSLRAAGSPLQEEEAQKTGTPGIQQGEPRSAFDVGEHRFPRVKVTVSSPCQVNVFEATGLALEGKEGRESGLCPGRGGAGKGQ